MFRPRLSPDLPAVCAAARRTRASFALLVAGWLVGLPAPGGPRAQDDLWDPASPDPARDTIVLHIDAPARMAVCVDGVLLTRWLRDGRGGDLPVRPGRYLVHGQMADRAYLSRFLNVTADADTAYLVLPEPPDLLGNWRGTIDGRSGLWRFQPLPCDVAECFDDGLPPCGIDGEAWLAGDLWRLVGITYDPDQHLFMMMIGRDEDMFLDTLDRSEPRLVFARLSADGRTLSGETAPSGERAGATAAGERTPFELTRWDDRLTFSAPPADGYARWTAVTVDAPAGTRLCVGGTPLPTDTSTFWAQPDVYPVLALGDGIMLVERTLDTVAAPAAATLTIPSQPDVLGRWTGRLDGAAVTIDLARPTAAPYGCDPDVLSWWGVWGELNGEDGEPSAFRLLREFRWLPDEGVIAFTGLQRTGAGDPWTPDRRFRLRPTADGKLTGTWTPAAAGNAGASPRAITLSRAAR